MLIKICGVKDYDTAYFAATHGADMVGIVLYPNSKRHVDLPLAREIAAATVKGGALPVLVFKDASASDVLTACETLGIYTVQLHGTAPPLPDSYVRILANGSSSQIRADTEFLLFDNAEPGSGVTFDWASFVPPTGVKWILSGGLTTENVVEAIHLLKPDGVDVSSGVERDGSKQKLLIEQFIEKVRNYE